MYKGEAAQRRRFYPRSALTDFLEGLSSGEASLYVVPPFDLVALAQLPAEQNDAPVAQ